MVPQFILFVQKNIQCLFHYRYGFNSDGHDRVFERLSQIKETRPNIVLGVNLGKNKSTEIAHDDYIKGINKFASVADYFVVNISSPNTGIEIVNE